MNEIIETFNRFRGYALEQSTAKDYITNYLDCILKHIAIRLAEDDLILVPKKETPRKSLNECP